MNKSNLPKNKIKNLEKIANGAFDNIDFDKALQVFEEADTQYQFNEKMLYLFGMLYDHLAQQFKSGFQKPKSDKKADFYFKKAEEKYKSILRNNPKSYNAWYGLGKICRNKGDYEKALLYSKKAYNLKGNKKAVYGIGFIYETMKDYVNAEKWYKKEIHDRGIKDGIAVSNYFLFANRQYKKKMRPYALIAEKYFEKQSIEYKNSKIGKGIKKELEIVLDKNLPK